MENILSIEVKAYEKYHETKLLGFSLARGDDGTLPILDEKASVFPSMNTRREKAICERELLEIHCRYRDCMNHVRALGRGRNTMEERLALLENFIQVAAARVDDWIEKYQLITYELLSSLPHHDKKNGEEDGRGYSQAL